MKKTIIFTLTLILCIAIFASCAPNEQKISPNVPPETEVVTGAPETVLPATTAPPETQAPASNPPASALPVQGEGAELKQKLDGLPVDDIYGPEDAFQLMLLPEFEKVPDDIVAAFISYHQRLIDSIMADESRLEQIVDMTLEDQNANFYLIKSSEGMPYAVTDMTVLYDALSGRLSPAMEAYLQIGADYAQDVMVDDAALLQSWDYLAEFMMRYYDFAVSNPGFVYEDMAMANFRWALSIYSGYLQLDNTPSIKNDSLIYQVRESYEDFLEKYADAPIAKDIKALNDAWKANNYTLNDAVQERIDLMGKLVM